MSGDVSPAAEAANRRLYEMRAARPQRSSETSEVSTSEVCAQPPQRPATDRGEGQGGIEVTSHSEGFAPVSGSPLPPSHPYPRPQRSADSCPPTSEVCAQPPQHPATEPPTIRALTEAVNQLPAHLGWGSETLSAHLRRRAWEGGKGGRGEREKGSRGESEQGSGSAHPFTPSPFPPFDEKKGSRGEREQGSGSAHPFTPAPLPPFSKIYPSIALGMLREERTAAGRVWLLLRALDAPGRGMVGVAEARAALTSQASPLRLCGWRRLRQLLAEGEGVFWSREKGRVARPQRSSETSEVLEDRLRLFGPARVAAALGVRRLVGRPVGVAVASLLGPIGDARAHLYATFHSGRAGGITNWELRITNYELRIGEGEQGGKGEGGQGRSSLDALDSSARRTTGVVARNSTLGNPVSRDTLTALAGVCARSQAAYERRAGVAARANIALGERVAAGSAPGPAEQERAWQRGRALFRLKDYRGLNGRPGATYLAWRLPNAFGSARGHEQRPKGRQKRINRQLADLFTKGMTGNGAAAVEKRFFGTATAAFRAAEKGSRGEREKGRRGEGERGRASAPAPMLPHTLSPFPSCHWPLVGARRGGCRVWATVEG